MKPKHKASVAFEPDVVEYLEQLQARLDRDRSWIINRLVRHHKHRVEQGDEQIDVFDPSLRLVAQ